MSMPSHPLRLGLLLFGWISLTLGIIGIVLPLLPTTPFVLLSAYCFSKSSPQLHQWLLQQPTLGPMIQNWERYGSISKGAKVTATVLLISFLSVSLLILEVGMMVSGGILSVAVAVLLYIWTRPTSPLMAYQDQPASQS